MFKKMQRRASPTNVDGVVGHHVLVVVEPELKVVTAFFVTKKPLQTQMISQNQKLWRLLLFVIFLMDENIYIYIYICIYIFFKDFHFSGYGELAYHLYGAVD